MIASNGTSKTGHLFHTRKGGKKKRWRKKSLCINMTVNRSSQTVIWYQLKGKKMKRFIF